MNKNKKVDYSITRRENACKSSSSLKNTLMSKLYLTEVRQTPVTGKRQGKQKNTQQKGKDYETSIREIRIGDGIVYGIPLVVEINQVKNNFGNSVSNNLKNNLRGAQIK